MHGPNRDRAEPLAEGREDRRQRFGPMDHREPANGREQRQRRDDPGLQRRIGGREHVSARAPRVGRGANPAGNEKRRIGDDEVGFAVREPRGATRGRVERIEFEDADAIREAVGRCVLARQSREAGIDLDQIGARLRQRVNSARATAPTPDPTSTIRRAGGPAAAASKTASAPTRCPERICLSRRRPPRISSRLVSGVTQFAGEAGLTEQPARAIHLV